MSKSNDVGTATTSPPQNQLEKLQAELDAAKRNIAELTERVEQLTKEKSNLEVLCDCYAKNILALLPKEPTSTWTQEEVDDLIKNGVGIEDVLEELEKLKGT